MDIFNRILRSLKRIAWAFVVAYMLGIHNSYKQEDKSPDTIALTIQTDEKQDDSAPKD